MAREGLGWRDWGRGSYVPDLCEAGPVRSEGGADGSVVEPRGLGGGVRYPCRLYEREQESGVGWSVGMHRGWACGWMGAGIPASLGIAG